MDKELAVVRDLKRRVQVASALEEAGRFDEADAIWSEMERIASSDDMIRSAQLKPAVKGLRATLPWLKKVFSPAARTERAVGEQVAKGLREVKIPKGKKLWDVVKPSEPQAALERIRGGAKEVDVPGLGKIKAPSRLYTHGPAAGAAGAGALGLYGLGRMQGGSKGYQRGMEEGIKEGYTPQPYGGAYYVGGGGGGMMAGGEGGPIVGPVPGSAGPDFSAMLGDIEVRIRRLETKVGEIESGLMKPSAPASTPKTPEPAASTPTSSKPAGPPKEA